MIRTIFHYQIICALIFNICADAQSVPSGEHPLSSLMDDPKIWVVSVPDERAYVNFGAADFEWSESGNKDDPASKIYKKGYNLILDEEWGEARKIFAELIKNYPKSEYIDDAHYWSAYALKHYDRWGAIETYKKFIKNFPNSKYYDDAIADANELDATMIIRTSGVDSLVYYIDSGKVRGFSYRYFTPSDTATSRDLKRATRQLQHRFKQMRELTLMRLKPVSPISPSIYAPGSPFRSLYGPESRYDEEKLDPETQLRMEALHALGEKEDSTSYRTLKEIALDRSQARQLRVAVMEILVDYKKYDPLPIFLAVAKNDTSEEIQNTAIDFIGMRTKDKNRSVETLIELFNAVPERRKEQREVIFYSIAEIGNDNAVDFLTKVARTNEDYDLRFNAIHYLGSIGSEKARSALYEILREK